MRTVLIEDADELIELRLLLEEIFGGRLGGFLLQGQMHTFVAAVLLGVSGLDALEVDAESQPPHGQLGQTKERVGTGEW